MKDESLRITLVTDSWHVHYQGWIPCPLDWPEVGDEGTASIGVEDMLNDIENVTKAVAWAKKWAADSGFKAGAVKFEYGNRLRIPLRRP